MKYARITNNTAVDVRTDSPDGCYTPEVVAEFVQVSDDVENGWVLTGGAWAAPAPVVPVEPVPVVVAVTQVSPVEFKLLFTASERIAMRTARASDPILEDFFDIAEDPRLTFVDLSIASTQQAIGYMVALGLLTAERGAQVLEGTKP